MTNHLKFLLFFILICSFSRAYAQSKLTKTKVTEIVSAKIPDDFRPMTDDELANKYFTYKKPTAMFTDPSVKVDFGVNENETEFKYEDLEMMQKLYKSTINRMFTNITVIKEEIRLINKYKFAVFEFVSEVKSEEHDIRQLAAARTYSYILYTIVDGKIVIVNFSCPASLQTKWQPIANEVMTSVKVK